MGFDWKEEEEALLWRMLWMDGFAATRLRRLNCGKACCYAIWITSESLYVVQYFGKAVILYQGNVILIYSVEKIICNWYFFNEWLQLEQSPKYTECRNSLTDRPPILVHDNASWTGFAEQTHQDTHVLPNYRVLERHQWPRCTLKSNTNLCILLFHHSMLTRRYRRASSMP